MPEMINVPKTLGMSGRPYYEGQEPSPCGCYYPDVTRISDNRNFFCIRHGRFLFKLDNDTIPSEVFHEIPTDKWREIERKAISQKH